MLTVYRGHTENPTDRGLRCFAATEREVAARYGDEVDEILITGETRELDADLMDAYSEHRGLGVSGEDLLDELMGQENLPLHYLNDPDFEGFCCEQGIAAVTCGGNVLVMPE